jgi:hypothetical protein
MVLIFVAFGIQKFTPQSAHGIVLYISNSPFVSWLSIFGVRGEAYFLGVIELSCGPSCGRVSHPRALGHRFADGSGDLCHYMVVLFHDARCR